MAGLFASTWLAACGGGGHSGGNPLSEEPPVTVFVGNLSSSNPETAGVGVCVDSVDPAVCVSSDAAGNFRVGAAASGEVLLGFTFAALHGQVCLAGVPDQATVTLTDVSCSAHGFCAPASIAVNGEPTTEVTLCNGDADGDGVDDDTDLCPGTPAGVAVDADGCSIDQLAPCGGPPSGGGWSSHDEYVAAVTSAAGDFHAASIITEAQAGEIVAAAAGSDCGEHSPPPPTPTPTPTCDSPDADGDCVGDDHDACPGTAPGAAVNADGCSVDQLVPCEGPASGGSWANHGDYVSAVASAVNDFRASGAIGESQGGQIVATAAESDCGDHGSSEPTPTPTPSCGSPDADGDCVADDHDQCPGTAPGAAVDSVGCSVSQLVPCDGPTSGGTWKNHGEYVSAVGDVSRDFVNDGLLTHDERADLVTVAAQSDCGKPGSEPPPGPTPTPDPSPEADDADADGVADDVDECPSTTTFPVTSEGCSLSQLVPCDGWKNHGEYVSAVSDVTRDLFVAAGLMTHEERSDAVVEAAHSDCGK